MSKKVEDYKYHKNKKSCPECKSKDIEIGFMVASCHCCDYHWRLEKHITK